MKRQGAVGRQSNFSWHVKVLCQNDMFCHFRFLYYECKTAKKGNEQTKRKHVKQNINGRLTVFTFNVFNGETQDYLMKALFLTGLFAGGEDNSDGI